MDPVTVVGDAGETIGVSGLTTGAGTEGDNTDLGSIEGHWAAGVTLEMGGEECLCFNPYNSEGEGGH